VSGRVLSQWVGWLAGLVQVMADEIIAVRFTDA
jgi:hypothetical protein